MKKFMFTLFAMLTMAAGANAMSYEQARQEALFLTDKMAYELNLTDSQYEAAYEINLDYLMSVTGRTDVFGSYWERRNLDLSYILYSWQWDAFCAASYFYRPLYWDAGYWHFGIYARYPRRDYFYFGRPAFFDTYRGGHSWRMNGGRSFYEGRRDQFRPGGISRDHHVGMRDGWDRGSYRGRGGSSTRITGGDRGTYRNGGFGRDNRNSNIDNRNSGFGRDNRNSNIDNRNSGFGRDNRNSNIDNRNSGYGRDNRNSNIDNRNSGYGRDNNGSSGSFGRDNSSGSRSIGRDNSSGNSRSFGSDSRSSMYNNSRSIESRSSSSMGGMHSSGSMRSSGSSGSSAVMRSSGHSGSMRSSGGSMHSSGSMSSSRSNSMSNHRGR